jgi:hypothetical protein
MEYLIGLVLASAVAAMAMVIGLDRGRAFYPTVLIVIASYYVLFAVIGASRHALIFEIVTASGFLLIALVGFKKNLWLVAIGTIGHGVFDFVHHRFIANPGMPSWWPGFCMVFDVVFGCFLAVRLITRALPLPDAR